MTPIDTTFDFQSDADGRDPDRHSPTLRRYHRALWDKPLPSGVRFTLSDTAPDAYLRHTSKLGDFVLTSDSIAATYTRWKRLSHLTDHFSEDAKAVFRSRCYTIGAMLVFPGYRVDGEPTINMARGCDPLVCDRIDLTLECIRRHYAGESSPLSHVLARYADFFALFGDFTGYVAFFLLDDLVDSEGAMGFLLPFDDFAAPGTPQDLASYITFLANTFDFVDARNRRIAAWAA